MNTLTLFLRLVEALATLGAAGAEHLPAILHALADLVRAIQGR